MKKTITLLFCITALLNGTNAQNLAANPGFEADVATFTVVENSKNVLMRSNVPPTGGTILTSAPTATSISVTDGLWLKSASSSSWLKGVVTTDDYNTGSSCLNLYMAPAANTAIGTYNKWYTLKAFQRIPASTLNNAKKYIVTFSARIDGTANNGLIEITPFLSVNGVNWANKTISLTGGTTWTQYTAIIDLPSFIAAEALLGRTHDFTGTVYFGFSFGTTADGNGNALYAGALIDDITLEVDTTTRLSTVKMVTNLFHIADNKIISNTEGKVSVYSAIGNLILNVYVIKGEALPLKSGVYIIKSITSSGCLSQKIIL